MYIKMSWQDYCIYIFKKEINKAGGIRDLEKTLGLDKSIVSKIVNHKLVPTKKFMLKWFPDLNIPEFTADVEI